MIDSVMRITLNLQETNTLVSVKAKRGDTGRRLLIHLSDGSIPYPVAQDCYAVFTARKSDGSKIHNPCTIENQVIEYTFTEQTCASPGTMHCEIRLYGGDRKLLTSACFLMTVLDTVYHEGDEVSSEGEMTTLDALIADCQAMTPEDIGDLLKAVLYAFPLGQLRVFLPGWMDALEQDHPLKNVRHLRTETADGLYIRPCVDGSRSCQVSSENQKCVLRICRT